LPEICLFRISIGLVERVNAQQKRFIFGLLHALGDYFFSSVIT